MKPELCVLGAAMAALSWWERRPGSDFDSSETVTVPGMHIDRRRHSFQRVSAILTWISLALAIIAIWNHASTTRLFASAMW